MEDKHRLILKVKYNLHLSPQEALCVRMLDFSHVMDLVTKITNLIQGSQSQEIYSLFGESDSRVWGFTPHMIAHRYPMDVSR